MVLQDLKRDPWLAAIITLSLFLNLFHISWGLPNGNDSWAADANGPVTVLSIVYRSFQTFNSGWFYFKYPVGYPFELFAVFSPYLFYLFGTGQWTNPSTKYPYGFANPEQALFVLAILGRMLSVLFATGTVLVTYRIALRLADRNAARIAALLVAACYPIVYYAHTTNLDAGYLFWLILALDCAISAAGTNHKLPWVMLGFAAAMAVSTKEQGFAFLLPLPVMAIAAHARRIGIVATMRQTPVSHMAGAAIVTGGLANNIIFNPMGFVARIAYLLGSPLYPINARLAPVEFAFFKGAKEWTYVAQLADGLSSSFGLTIAVLVLIGAFASFARPKIALWILLPALSHYYLSLRGLDLITLRYLLPLMVTGAVLVAFLLSTILRRTSGTVMNSAAVALVLIVASYSVARAVELDLILANDSRYQVEQWMREKLPPGSRGEMFQKASFVPRVRDGLESRFVPMPERSKSALVERKPDFIVVSSASRKSITHTWAQDWRQGLLAPNPAAQEMLQGIEDGTLGYEPGIVVEQSPRLFRSRITSLCPTVTVYVRRSSGT